MKYQRESLWDALPGIKELMWLHWDEVALNKSVRPLEPDYSRYHALENKNCLVVVTCRDDSGQMVGYSVFFLCHHIHYKTWVTASNDIIYLRPENRGVAGVKLIKKSEEVLTSLGVDQIVWHIKPGNDWSDVLSRMGYVQEEIIMGKATGVNHGI